jgi:hypothetical protein
LNPGDQEVGPVTRDAQTGTVVLLAATNSDGKVVHQRAATHEGHAAREVLIIGRSDDQLTAMRVVVGERCCVRIAVTGSDDGESPDAALDAAAEFFNAVRLGPGFGPPILEDPLVVSAADLGAAYLADPAAADARFKGRWLRVSGPVTTVGADGTTLDLDAGGAAITVQRMPRGRQSVRVRQGGESVTVTGKCQGRSDPAAGQVPRVRLTDAVVIRPPTVEDAK